MLAIQPAEHLSSCISVPGSKSYTHRILIATALSDGTCKIENALTSDDTELTIESLRLMGVNIKIDSDKIIVNGTRGRLTGSDKLYLGNSGTGMRFFTALAAMAEGRSVLTGNARMKERPISNLIDGLKQLGVKIRSLKKRGYPPVEVIGRSIEGGHISLNCDISSQYLSAILLIAPYTKKGVYIDITGEPVSKPYIDMTVDVMEKLGVTVSRKGYSEFYIPGGQIYSPGDYFVEPDASNASYFWAAAAITGGRVMVEKLTENSGQGDMHILKCFEEMGCHIERGKDGTTVIGESLHGIDVDMGDMPDMVPTIAVVAAFADGVTVIRNIEHLKVKESDRITAVRTELKKMGINTRYSDGVLEIFGGSPHGAEIDTYNDHRIAMSFSVAGLKVPGLFIKNEKCVSKSFPNYWDLFRSLYTGF